MARLFVDAAHISECLMQIEAALLGIHTLSANAKITLENAKKDAMLALEQLPALRAQEERINAEVNAEAKRRVDEFDKHFGG